MRCKHCPLVGSCQGEEIPRLCELVDPSHPEYDPAYLSALEQAYPPLATQVAGLVGSLANWFRAGCPITPAAERARRREICTACPEFDQDQRRCRKCGCFGDVKPWLGTATCPLDKWKEDE